MALHYDLKDVKADWNDDAIWPITNALIWGTMSVAMNSITEKDWREFYTRCHMIETIHGAWLFYDHKPRFITPDDVQSHIGLHTNASQMTNARFKTSIDKRLRQQAAELLRK